MTTPATAATPDLRAHVVQHDGRPAVRLAYPGGTSGQVLRPDILADPETTARYLREWAAAWAYQDDLDRVHRDRSADPAYDAARLDRLIDSDAVLERCYETRIRKRHPNDVLREIFDEFVVGDPARTAEYLAI